MLRLENAAAEYGASRDLTINKVSSYFGAAPLCDVGALSSLSPPRAQRGIIIINSRPKLVHSAALLRKS